MNLDVIHKAEKELSAHDPVLGTLISAQKLTPRTRSKDYFTSLCRSIIGQQVSVAAAATIFERFCAETKLKPETVLKLDEMTVKKIGLSRQKVSYIHDLAGHFVNNPDVYTHLEKQTDQEAIAELTEVKGIGVWTAQMFLMFTLERPDVFASDDAGLQRAMMKLYGWQTLPHKKTLEGKAGTWKPYRTIASLHLWQSLDSQPNQ